MRLNNFIEETLNEKVTKKEKESALKNNNILVGAEFEFKPDETIGVDAKEVEAEYDKAMQDYDNYNTDVDRYNTEVEEYNSETEEIENEIDEIEAEIDSLTDSISETEEIIEGIDDELTDLDPVDDEDRYDFLSDRKQDLESDLDSDQSNLESKEREYEEKQNDVKYRKEEGQYEMINGAYFDHSQYSDYLEYLSERMGYYDFEDPEPNEKLDVQPTFYESDLNSDFENDLDNTMVLSDVPFNNYEVGEYGTVTQKPGSSLWAIESDSSVPNGVEVKSPPMVLPRFIPDTLKDMFDWINDIGYTDSDCGFHVHMSLKKSKPLDPLKLLLFTEEDYVFNLFPERKGNSYAKSIKDKLKTSGMFKKQDLSKMLDVKHLLVKMNAEHFDGVSIIDLEKGHVEFRYMGGTDYSKEYKKVVDVISSYAYWLSLAADPEFKKNEYVHKVSRIYNKMELFEYMFNVAYLESYLEKDIHAISETKIRVLMDSYKKKLKPLERIYKMSKKTKGLLVDNPTYMDSLRININQKIDSLVHKDDNTNSSKIYGIHIDTRMKLRK